MKHNSELVLVDDPVSAAAPSSGQFADLYEREYAPMVRLATLIIGSLAMAEEVVHDSFLSVWQRQLSVERPGAYLRQVVVNNSRSAIRRLAGERRKVSAVAAAESTRALDLAPVLDETWQALERLSPKQRTALVLRYYEDLRVDDIAEVMGTRPGTVKSLLHRGLKKLRTEMV